MKMWCVCSGLICIGGYWGINIIFFDRHLCTTKATTRTKRRLHFFRWILTGYKTSVIVITNKYTNRLQPIALLNNNRVEWFEHFLLFVLSFFNHHHLSYRLYISSSLPPHTIPESCRAMWVSNAIFYRIMLIKN